WIEHQRRARWPHSLAGPRQSGGRGLHGSKPPGTDTVGARPPRHTLSDRPCPTWAKGSNRAYSVDSPAQYGRVAPLSYTSPVARTMTAQLQALTWCLLPRMLPRPAANP